MAELGINEVDVYHVNLWSDDFEGSQLKTNQQSVWMLTATISAVDLAVEYLGDVLVVGEVFCFKTELHFPALGTGTYLQFSVT